MCLWQSHIQTDLSKPHFSVLTEKKVVKWILKFRITYFLETIFVVSGKFGNQSQKSFPQAMAAKILEQFFNTIIWY